MQNRLAGSIPIRRRATACLLLLLITTSCDISPVPTQPPPTPSAGPVVTEIRDTRTAATPGGPPGASPTPLIATPEPTPTLLPESERSEIFESVCQTVKDHYLYTDFHGANWGALCGQYR